MLLSTGGERINCVFCGQIEKVFETGMLDSIPVIMVGAV